MRLSAVLALLAGVLALAALIWGLDGFLLAFVYAVPVSIIVVVAAYRGQPKWRVQLYLVMWTITRPVAFFVGLTAGGWFLALLLLAIAIGLESVARYAHSRGAAN